MWWFVLHDCPIKHHHDGMGMDRTFGLGGPQGLHLAFSPPFEGVAGGVLPARKALSLGRSIYPPNPPFERGGENTGSYSNNLYSYSFPPFEA